MGATTGGGVAAGLSPKMNLIAVVAPTATDDITKGYTEGSVWIDTVANVAYTCVDDTQSSAIWVTQGGGGGGGGAPASSEYAVASPNAGIPNARVLTNSPTITWDFSVPGVASAAASGINWGESGSISSPNNVVGAVVWQAVSGLANSDAAVAPKGTGAFLLQVPDSTISGGNKRGQYAVDLQRVRSSPDKVASGNNSVISGGNDNTATGLLSVVTGGYNNSASGDYSSVGGGFSNSAAGLYSTVSGGNNNSSAAEGAAVGGGQFNSAIGIGATVSGGTNNNSTGARSTVGSGEDNNADGISSTVSGGSGNSTTGDISTVGGGQFNSSIGVGATVSGGTYNEISATYGTIPGGRGAATRDISGAYAWSGNEGFVVGEASGDSQEGKYLLKIEMTGVTPVRLSTDRAAASSTNQIVLSDNSSYVFVGEAVIRNAATGNTSLWRIEGGIRRGAGAATTAFVGTPTITLIAANAGAVTWSMALSADTTLGCLGITVAAAAAVTVRAVARITTTELVY